MFCSEECEKNAALSHYNDFGEIYNGDGSLKKSLKMQHEAFRVAGGVDEALELLEEAEGKTIFDVDLSTPKDPCYEKNILIAVNGLWRRDFVTNFSDQDLEPLVNVPPINGKTRTAEKRKQLVQFILNQRQIFNANSDLGSRTQQRIYLFRPLLNHSCYPNVDCYENDGITIAILCRPVTAGEQLFGWYAGAHVMRLSKIERHRIVMRSHHFKCDCEACVKDWTQEFPKRDRSFIEPQYKSMKTAEAVETFQRNCKYIDKNSWEMPCYEVMRLIKHNGFLVFLINGGLFVG